MATGRFLPCPRPSLRLGWRNLHRGRTVLWIGRILGVLPILGGFNAIGGSSLLMNHPGIRALLIAKLAIGVVITISLFLPGVGKAPTLPSPASGGLQAPVGSARSSLATRGSLSA